MDKLKETDDLNEKLREELESKTVQLINSSNDLAHSHSELIKSRREINVSVCYKLFGSHISIEIPNRCSHFEISSHIRLTILNCLNRFETLSLSNRKANLSNL